jgi:prolyl-tRNA synthetase
MPSPVPVIPLSRSYPPVGTGGKRPRAQRGAGNPRGGLLRSREFLMKDGYSFDLDDEGLAASYAGYRAAYQRILERLGVEYRIVSATSGAMGGSASEEFLAPTPVGEDTFAACACGYAANVEAVTTPVPAPPARMAGEAQVIDTPDTPTIDSLGGLRVLFDDRSGVSAGVRFADAELLGVPFVVVAGRRLADGQVELRERANGGREDVPVDSLGDLLRVRLG